MLLKLGLNKRPAHAIRLAGLDWAVVQEPIYTYSNKLVDIYTTVTKEPKQREFGNFEEKMEQQRQEWGQNI